MNEPNEPMTLPPTADRATPPISILHLEDNPDDSILIGLCISKEIPCAIRSVATEQEYVDALGEGEFDLILSDYRLTPYDGDQALLHARDVAPHTPFIMVTGEIGEDRAIETLKRGAWDYVLKDNLKRLVPAIHRALHEAENDARRRNAETALRESEMRFRTMADTAPVIIWMVDTSMTCIYLNKVFAEFTGEPEVTGSNYTSWTDFVHENDRERVWDVFVEAFEARREFSVELRHLRAGGDYHWALVRGVPRLSPDGVFEGYIGTTVDISEQKHREDEAKGNELTYQKLLLSLPAALYTTDCNGVITLFNENAAVMWGREPVIGQDLWCGSWKIFNADGSVMPHDECPMAETLKTGVAVRGREIVVERPDGTRGTVAPFPTPLYDDDGVMIGAVNMLVDITDIKRTEEELLLSRERFLKLAESMPHLAWIQNGAGTLEYVNRQWYSYTGLSRSDTMTDSERRRQAIHGDDFPLVNAIYKNALLDGLECTVEYRLRRADGHYRWHLARLVPVRNGEGDITEWFGTATDIHEIKLAQEQISISNEELERRVSERTSQLEIANRNLDEFAHSISHDLRSPLRTITGMSQIVLSDYSASLDPEGIQLLERIVKGAINANTLIDALLAFSRFGTQGLSMERVDTKAIVEEILLERKFDGADKHVKVTIYDLPPVTADPVLICQVFENLISNAFKYSRLSDQPTLIIGSFCSNGDNVYFVKDNGIGFDQSQLGDLFTPFGRLHHDQEYEGIGIGLLNVKRIVERHGGRVWAEGELGVGATFYFSLPRSSKDLNDGTSAGHLDSIDNEFPFVDTAEQRTDR